MSKPTKSTELVEGERTEPGYPRPDESKLEDLPTEWSEEDVEIENRAPNLARWMKIPTRCNFRLNQDHFNAPLASGIGEGVIGLQDIAHSEPVRYQFARLQTAGLYRADQHRGCHGIHQSCS